MSIDRLQPISPAALAARTSGPGIPASRTAPRADGTSSMSTDAFRAALKRGIARDAAPTVAAAAAAEAARRLTQGRLEVSDLRVLLLETPGSEVWAAVRRAALTTVTASPELAPSIISMHAQLLRLPAATVREGQDAGSQDGFHAQATLTVDDQQISGSIQCSRTRKGARQQAMTTLIAAIAGLPDPLADRAVEAWGASASPAVPPPAPAPRAGSAPAAGRSPISVLHEFAQAGHTTTPDFRVTGAASAFTATVTAVHRGQKLAATGEGTSKQSARAAAASSLLEMLQQALAADVPPAPAPEPPTPSNAPALLPPLGLARTQEPPPPFPPAQPSCSARTTSSSRPWPTAWRSPCCPPATPPTAPG